MMAQALQGIQQQYALNGFPMQAPYTQTAAQILQLDNMDPDSSPVRIMVQHKIVQYLKEREEFCNLNLHYLVAISKNIDEQFFKEAESQVHYMDFETVKVRLSAVLSSGSFGNSRYAWVSSVASSTVNSEQLPGIEVPDLSVQHGRAVPGSTNLPLCARGLSTHNVFSSQRYVPNDHHKVAANFACSSADNIKRRPESLINTTVAPCVLALPKCSPGLGGGDRGGVHNGHIKDHFPGDAHQVDSPQRSTSGSSSSSSARCDRTTSSSAMTTFSIDSVSTANGQKLSTNNNIYSVSQGPSSLQYRECEEYAWSHPLEQSDQSNISSSSSSERCDRTTSSSAMTTFSIDSVPTANGQELSTNNNIYSVSQGPSSLQYRECEKELEYAWSHPLEQSDQSNITTGGQDLLYLYDHTNMCPYIKGECGLDGCMQMKEKLCHISDYKGFCREKCSNIGTPFTHYQCCVMTDYNTCGLVEERVEIEQTSNSTVSKLTSPTSDECSGKHRLAKRLKVDSPNLVHVNEIEIPNEQQPVVNETHVSAETVQSETTELRAKSPCCSSLGDNNASTNIVLGPTSEDLHNVEIVRSSEIAVQTEEELCYENVDIEMKDTKVGSLNQTSIGANLSARKKRGASILYALTAEELRDHMRSLNQHTCPMSELDLIQSKVTTEELQLVEGLPDQNTCSLCGMERLLFEPPPRFCALCFKIINSTGSYYVEVENGNKMASICGRCHHLSSAKAKYQKKFSYAETDAEAEWWVQCDKCKAWQHQICALFNPKIVEAEAEYTCAKCFLKEKDSGDIDSLESSTVLGAWELPRTKLSDHIEQRLSERLEQERQQRASASRKVIEEVPSVEGLTVRVVSSAARVLQVQPRFREFFKQEKYPGKFPYKSKAILLFQKNQGVDVCLFAMYVQEYGSSCPLPNQRHVYLAYIDSVKYFRPEIKSANGEALRTFVYHEILIGYLDYCKKRGFVSCSIWACPSTKRDDYVLYCHPTTQKMPKSDKLRSWYQNLIKKAVKEGVVVERNTLYDFFIQPTNECKANISAACLPYCENDFWPGEAERLLEKKDDNTSQKKETQVGRLLRVAKRDDRKGNLEDILLVHRLGERMRTMKEDFIMLCLQQFCKHCHQPVVSGKSWACISCKNFHLCDQCHAEELNTPQKDRHPATTKQKHAFQRIEEEPLPETDDGDPTMESKYFDSRIDFLKHCQDNQYQFDTLRRAKHTTLMILYHLHDSACSACHCAMDQCLAWRCLVCLGCNFCDSCYKQNGEKLHIHKLRQTDNHHTLQQYTLQDYLDGLVHASRCFDLRNCTSKLCALLKKLFFHGVRCYIRARNRGGCRKCAFMWKLLLTHSKHCDHVDCSVPRCRDIKVFMAESKKHTGPCVVQD